MKIFKLTTAFLLATSLLVSTVDASAAGVALDARNLDAKSRAELTAQIAAAKQQTPELFTSAFDIAQRAGELDAAGRTPGIPLTRHFRNLGPRAYYPLMELLVFDAHAPAGLSDSATSALRLGVIEAIGQIREARAVPFLARLLDARDVATVEAAAAGLAKIGNDDALTALTSAAVRAKAAEGPRERAILAGMHDCRRERAARFLADRLRERPEAETARVIVKSLGGVGNRWAWTTLAARTEEAATRTLAAEALVTAFVAYADDVRESSAKAMLVVDSPTTTALVAAAKASAPRDTVLALERFERRFAANPSR